MARSWAVAGILLVSTLGHAEPPAPIGTRVTDLAATNAGTGKPWALADQARDAKAVVVVFLATECPISNQYVPVLAKLHKEFSAQGVQIVGVFPLPQDSAEDVAKHAKAFDLPFPVLRDDGTVAERLKAVRVPEAFVLDGTRTVRYRGRIDDQFGRGVARPEPTRRDLAEAIKAVLAGRDVSVPATEAVGCPIARSKKPAAKAKEPVTFTKDVSRILQARCQECHRPGEIGPFSLLTYKQATDWAEAIREAVSDGRMPPWHASPAHGVWRNDRRLADSEKKTLLAWIEQGCPEGDAADLPPPRKFVEGWAMGKPDQVLSLDDPVEVPAEAPKGGMRYVYRLLGKPFEEDRWMRGAEVQPSARGVVHHVLVYARPPHAKPLNPKKSIADQLFDWVDLNDPDVIGNGLVGAYVPGERPSLIPDGMAVPIKKGTQLILELHYTPNGKATKDRTSVGFLFAKEAPRYEVRTRSVLNVAFVIPPFAANHAVTQTTTFDRDAVLLALTPHMHLRGKDFKYTLVTPDGKREVLLEVPRYDFNWQTRYEIKDPRRIPKGSKIECLAHFDNSRANPNNPNPWRVVTWGEQTFEEMMIGFVNYYYPE